MNPNENNGAQPSNDLPPYAQPTPAPQPAQGSPSPQGQQPAYANAQSAPQQPQSVSQTPHDAPQFAQNTPQGAPAGTTTVDMKESVNKFADALGKQHLKIGNHEVAYGNLVTVVGALLAIIGVFLPFASISAFGVSMSVSLMPHGDGWILLIGAVVIAVLAVLRQEIAALTVTIIYTLLVIYEIAAAGSKISQSGYGTLLQLSYGAGMWLLIIAIIVMLIGTIFAFYNKQRAKNAQNGAPAMPVQNPAYDASYQDNGWQFGVPAQSDPSNVDNSQWQFGVESARRCGRTTRHACGTGPECGCTGSAGSGP